MSEGHSNPFSLSSADSAVDAAARRKPMSRFSIRRVLVWFFVMTVVLELSLRLIFGLGSPLLFISDPACSYVLAPNQNIRRFFAVNQINAYSMRSPTVGPKRVDEYRILFIGDSVLNGQTYTPQARIFTSLLGNSLPARLHRPVTVFNASAGGWAVGNEVAYLRSRGGFQSNAIVMVVNTEDLVQPFNDTTPGSVQMPIKNPPLALVEVWTRYVVPTVFGMDLSDRGSKAAVQKEELQSVAATLHNWTKPVCWHSTAERAWRLSTALLLATVEY